MILHTGKKVAAMHESKAQAGAISQTINYGFSSTISTFERQPKLELATSLREARYPYFFEGRLEEAHMFARCLLSLAKVVETRFYIPPNLLQRLLSERDPVITSGAGALRFEGFSACASAYCRVDLLPPAYDGEIIEKGTTNVDFNPQMKAALAATLQSENLEIGVGKDEFVLKKGNEKTVEKKVKLPLRWLKSFVEVQAYQKQMEKRLTVSKVEALNFLRNLPSNANNQTVFFIVPAGRGLRLSQTVQSRPSANGAIATPIQIGGLKRLLLLKDLVPLIKQSQACALTVYSSPDGLASEWQIDMKEGLRFSLTMTSQPFRGFSGEGRVLENLTEIEEEKLALLRSALQWHQFLSEESLQQSCNMNHDALQNALAALGSRGLVGFDLSSNSYFHRELPFDLSLVESMHPRLKAAHKLVATDGVKVLPSLESRKEIQLEVRGSDVTHLVTGYEESWRCTCQWFSKYQGTRGLCKHILAAKLSQAQKESQELEEEEVQIEQ
ncbi:MAG: SWIM zinc finger domain-containing protein [Candidatus Obscuribacterales bacterium]|nr:SWIM zinc finger domain-containing protein [Candidatus Obscuribacterales bacterium]